MPRQTPLYTCHQEAGGRMVDFAGWLMPIQYQGIVAEHQVVRQKVGLFDVSHMGRFEVTGPGALDAIQYWICNDASALVDNQALYSPICTPEGGIVDDCLVYRLAAEHFIIVANASNRQKDFDWFNSHIGTDKPFTLAHPDDGDKWALLALQGPKARATLAPLCSADLTNTKKNDIVHASLGDISDCILACTGYTGEDGFEIFVPAARASDLWHALLEAGAPLGIAPCGLGARDTLRMEMRYPLYGNDIDETTTPIEAGLGWTVSLDKGDFIGRDVLAAQKTGKPPRRLISFILKERGIPRHGYPIFDAEGTTQLGKVTSGGYAPSLKQSIGLGYVPAKPQYAKIGSPLTIEIRGKKLPIEVVKAPFYRPQGHNH